MAKISLNNIDKSKWISYPFEKIAKRISESVDPNKTDLAVYIGLEHLDAETVHIRRHGSPSDVSGGKLKCYPGDIIFGKRRAYQRKAGIVEQEGICSAHSFVFRANEDIISARLFPFFLHSDQFMHRMVDISVGGLSPTINWSDLKHQEFLLPPKNQQAELADLLWAMDDVIEKDLKVLEKLEKVYKSNISKKLLDNKNGIEFIFKKNIKIIRGISFKPNNLSNKGVIILRSNNIQESKINYLDNIYLPLDSVDKNKLLNCGDFAICMSNGSKELVGKAAIIDDISDKKLSIGAFCAGLRTSTDYIPLIKHLLNSDAYRTKILQILSGSTINNLKPSDIENLKFDINKDFNIICNYLDKLILNKNSIETKLQSSKALQKSLINQIF